MAKKSIFHVCRCNIVLLPYVRRMESQGKREKEFDGAFDSVHCMKAPCHDKPRLIHQRIGDNV